MTRSTYKPGRDPVDPSALPDIPYTMTRRDKDEAMIYSLQAEQNRRRQNAEDDAKAAAKALEQEDWK